MRRLVVFVPGLTKRACDWQPLIDRLSKEPEFADTTWLPWDARLGLFSLRKAILLARELFGKINAHWVSSGGYDEVILTGHSVGAILQRQAYLMASGRYRDYPSAEWHAKVVRIVMFAGVHRGWDPDRVWCLKPLIRMLRACGLFQRMLISDLMRGSDFLTDLRIRWIRYFRATPDADLPMVVQLLGTRDGVVTRDDSIDLRQFPDVYQEDVPGAGHADILDLATAEDPNERYALLKGALAGTLRKRLTIPQEAARNPVVILLHGIRASNSDWPHDLEKMIKDRAPDAEVVLPGYPYFSALNFLFPRIRRRHVPLLQDVYSEYLARYPRATFHFVGHSNGTYLFGEALRQVPSMRFDRAVLVGSVLPQDFNWRVHLEDQLLKLRSDRALWDWPVGVLCSALRGLGMRDIGTGGFAGFLNRSEQVEEFYYHPGGHGYALNADRLENIAEYVLTGTGRPLLLLDSAHLSPAFKLFAFVSRLAPYFAWVFVALLGWGIWVHVISEFTWWNVAMAIMAVGVGLVLLDTI